VSCKGSGERVGKRASFNQAKKARHGRQRREGSGRALREAVEEKFDRGEDVLDYFDVSKARVIRPPSKSIAKTKVGWPPKSNSERRAVVREKSVRYRKKAS